MDDHREWVKERVDSLTANSDEIKDVAPNIYNEFDTWSALKLITHVATVNMYTTVISDHRDDFFYVDALAGSGVSVYGEREKCFLGSAILAAKNAAEPFLKMYFIEHNEEKANALEERLNYAFSSTGMDLTEPERGFEVLIGDANEELDNVVSDMWRVAKAGGKKPSFHHLTFVDNQGLDVTWDGIKTIAPKPTGDLLINFPTSSIVRSAHHEDSRRAVNDFYGGEMWDVEDISKSQLRETYCDRLTGVEKQEQVIANVYSGTKSYEYDMIYATRQTSGGSEYQEAVEYVREFVEAVDGADVEDMLKILQGDQRQMESYLPNEETDDGQSSLGDF